MQRFECSVNCARISVPVSKVKLATKKKKPPKKTKKKKKSVGGNVIQIVINAQMSLYYKTDWNNLV